MANRSIFISGPAGSGKTAYAIENYLTPQGQPGTLVLTPQRSLALPYQSAIHAQRLTGVETATIAGLARRMVDLYFPLIAAPAGFAHPNQPPTFLTLETAQYVMARILEPLLADGYFESVSIERNRLYSQVIDNLNKAAVNGYPHTEIGTRLSLATPGDPEQFRIHQDAQNAALHFREYCLAHNLLDFSLQIELFANFLWPDGSLCREQLRGQFRHLIYDNIEEEPPLFHDILREWLPELESAVLIHDNDAGYRRFLGADPESAALLAEACDEHIEMTPAKPHPVFESLGQSLAHALKQPLASRPQALALPELQQHLVFETHRYFPEMLDWTAEHIARLVNEDGLAPGEIAVLAPYLSDALRYSLGEKLNRRGIPWRSHRPSRSLRDEPVVEALLTLAALAHPQWGVIPTPFDVAYMLVLVIANLDLVRAQLLTEATYHLGPADFSLFTFEQVQPAVQERIGYHVGERFDRLREWLAAYQTDGEDELDFFLSRLFGEILAQPGFGFHDQLPAGEITANLIESIQKFRWITASGLLPESQSLGQEYLTMVRQGVLAALYVRSWASEEPVNAVLLAPAYTFLMRNQSVQVQFWLDAASDGWHSRLYQPITHPYVLNRHWPAGRVWSDTDEVAAEQESLYRLAVGLLRRCRDQVYLGLSDHAESGYESQGRLLQALQQVLQRTAQGTA